MDEKTPAVDDGRFLYDTVGSLPFSADSGEPVIESYEVFRNHIVSPLDSAAGEIPVADYFSLVVPSQPETSPSDESTPPPGPPPPPPPSQPSDDPKRATELAWFRAGCRFKSPMLQLHKEILDFCDFVSPTLEEQESRSAAVKRVFDVVKHIWPHCTVEVFGSFSTGLYLPTSDIDVVILNSRVRTPQIGLTALSRALSQRGIAKKLQVLGKARVPIIKFVEKQSDIAFDISFDIDNGPKAADFIKDAVQKLPPLRPLCLILKVFLQQRELNEVYSGGIGSYALIAMLIAHLKIHWGQNTLQSQHQSVEQNLGILLVNFFDFFGRKLNNTDVGVSCNSKRNLFLKSDKGFLNLDRPYLLSIEDPQAPDNDVARNSFNYSKVRVAFAKAYSSLTDEKTIIRLGSQKSILGIIIRPDPVLLDRKGGSNGELSFNKLLPGADEPLAEQFENGSDVIYNWELVDDEPLPRQDVYLEEDFHLSPKKRRTPKSTPRHSRNARHDVWGGDHENRGMRSEGREREKKRKGRDRYISYPNNLPFLQSRGH